MTGPLTVPTFRVIFDMHAIVDRSTLESSAEPFLQAISGLVYFTPSVKEVFSEADERFYAVHQRLGRITDGVLMTVNRLALDDTLPAEDPGDHPDHRRYGILLAANSNAFGPLPSLDYRVTFHRMVFARKERTVNPFTFEAPQEPDITVDLAKVPRTQRRVAGAL